MHKYFKYVVIVPMIVFVTTPVIAFGYDSVSSMSWWQQLSDLFSFIPSTQQTSAVYDVNSIRNLQLDAKGKTLKISATATEAEKEATLTEFSVSGIKIKDWKVKYEPKGHNRAICEPPMLNLSFDKKDSKGNNKELFTGLSTYAGNTQLQYQKIRLIPECDTWNDYLHTSSDVGFKGTLNVTLREYIIYKIFREFGIPVSDVVGFANVTFVNTDSKYAGKTYRYMIIQRPQEQDDQIPFTRQFNMDPYLYQSNEIDPGIHYGVDYWQVGSDFKEIVGGTMINTGLGKTVQIEFDPESTLKFYMLTEFLNLFDMGFLHNEDGGTDLSTGKVKRIPHGFDSSFSCEMKEPSLSYVANKFYFLPENLKPSYRSTYYKIARDVFGDISNLNRMIRLVDSFPYPDVDKTKLKEFLKLRFYQYAQYFNSQEFANIMGQDYRMINMSLPFSSNQEYEANRTAFFSTCGKSGVVNVPTQPVIPTVVNPTVTALDTPVLTIIDSTRTLNANFLFEVRAGSSDVRIPRSLYIPISLIGNKGNQYSVNGKFESITPLPASDNVYFVVQSNTSARFSLNGVISKDQLVSGDSYYAKIEKLQLNEAIGNIAVNVKTNTVSIDSSIEVVSVTPSAPIIPPIVKPAAPVAPVIPITPIVPINPVVSIPKISEKKEVELVPFCPFSSNVVIPSGQSSVTVYANTNPVVYGVGGTYPYSISPTSFEFTHSGTFLKSITITDSSNPVQVKTTQCLFNVTRDSSISETFIQPITSLDRNSDNNVLITPIEIVCPFNTLAIIPENQSSVRVYPIPHYANGGTLPYSVSPDYFEFTSTGDQPRSVTVSDSSSPKQSKDIQCYFTVRKQVTTPSVQNNTPTTPPPSNSSYSNGSLTAKCSIPSTIYIPIGVSTADVNVEADVTGGAGPYSYTPYRYRGLGEGEYHSNVHVVDEGSPDKKAVDMVCNYEVKKTPTNASSIFDWIRLLFR